MKIVDPITGSSGNKIEILWMLTPEYFQKFDQKL
jgi:hypothetical protein